MQTVAPTPLVIRRPLATLTLNISLTDGGRFQCPVVAGARIIDVIRAHGLPVKTYCNGKDNCESCHVRISHAWQLLLPPPQEDERAHLNRIAGADETSRMACKLIMNEQMDGLEVEVQPDSLTPQTFWIAG